MLCSSRQRLWLAEMSHREGRDPHLERERRLFGVRRHGIAGAQHQSSTEGLGELSMRSVAERLGFTTMSLYRHVPGKAELVELMRDAALGAPPQPETSEDWRSQLAGWARASLERHHRHPWRLEMELRAPFGPNHLRWLDAGLQAVSDLGLPDQELVSTVLAVDSYVRGAARLQVSMAREIRRSRSSMAELERVYARIFEAVVTSERYPTLARVIAAGAFEPTDPPRDEFEYGLVRVLDGIAVRIPRETSVR